MSSQLTAKVSMSKEEVRKTLIKETDKLVGQYNLAIRIATRNIERRTQKIRNDLTLDDPHKDQLRRENDEERLKRFKFEQDRESLLSQKKEALRKLNRGEVIFNDAEDGSEDVHLHEQGGAGVPAVSEREDKDQL